MYEEETTLEEYAATERFAPVTAIFGDPIEVRDDDGELVELIPQGVTLDANSPEDAARLSAALFVAADHPDEMAKRLGVEGVSP